MSEVKRFFAALGFDPEPYVEMIEDTDGTYVYYEDYESLRAQLAEAQGEIERLKNYADKLATGFPEGMLPKDIELLKESNAAMASDIESMGKGHPYPYVTPAKVIF